MKHDDGFSGEPQQVIKASDVAASEVPKADDTISIVPQLLAADISVADSIKLITSDYQKRQRIQSPLSADSQDLEDMNSTKLPVASGSTTMPLHK